MNFTEPQKIYCDQTFEAITLEGGAMEFKDFEECTFRACVFRETRLRGCRFLNCTFQACNLNLIGVKDSTFVNTAFQDSTLRGVNWTEAAWAKRGLFNTLRFVQCVIDHSTFSGLALKQIQLVQCLARNVDFTDADLTQANCTGTDFAQSRFFHTNLTKADFSGASNYAIAANLNTLKKTKFTLPEAVALLYNLDIILSE